MNRTVILPIPIPRGEGTFFEGGGEKKSQSSVFDNIDAKPFLLGWGIVWTHLSAKPTGRVLFFAGGFDVMPGAYELVRNARQQVVVEGHDLYVWGAHPKCKEKMQVTRQNGGPRCSKWVQKISLRRQFKTFFSRHKMQRLQPVECGRKRHCQGGKNLAGKKCKTNATVQQNKYGLECEKDINNCQGIENFFLLKNSLKKQNDPKCEKNNNNAFAYLASPAAPPMGDLLWWLKVT